MMPSMSDAVREEASQHPHQHSPRATIPAGTNPPTAYNLGDISSTVNPSLIPSNSHPNVPTTPRRFPLTAEREEPAAPAAPHTISVGRRETGGLDSPEMNKGLSVRGRLGSDQHCSTIDDGAPHQRLHEGWQPPMNNPICCCSRHATLSRWTESIALPPALNSELIRMTIPSRSLASKREPHDQPSPPTQNLTIPTPRHATNAARNPPPLPSEIQIPDPYILPGQADV